MDLSSTTALIVMGVSGSGKTTAAALLAGRLGWRFHDSDDLHPAANVAKMRAGTPLDDDDRWPWLDRVAAVIAAARDRGERVVIACSALKKSYRDRLRAGHDDVGFVFLDVDRGVLENRLMARMTHFMPASLLASQLATLEPPGADEDAVTVAVAHEPVVDVIDEALERLGAS